MATILQVVDGLETRLATISGLQAASEWKDTPNPPAAMVLPVDGDFLTQTTFSGRYSLFLQILVIVSQAAGIGKAYRQIYPYLDATGSQSIIAAIAGDTTLGGVAEDVDLGQAVWQVEVFRDFLVNGTKYHGAILTPVEVYITG